MKNQITPRDYELISAYLDNQLSQKERTRFEARLKVEPELSKEMQEISKTRSLLRTLPRLRAPHNYYIKAAATQARPVSLRLAPVFGIVSAVASVILALVIFSSRFFSTQTPVAMAPMVQNVSPTIVAQSEAVKIGAAPTTPTEEPPVVMLGKPPLPSPTPNISASQLGETENPTPTTIYLFAYLPTATPTNEFSIMGEKSGIPEVSCENYYGGGEYPTLPYLYHCPTPTGIIAENLESLLAITSPTASETPTTTLTLTPTATPTPNPTSTLTPSPTPTPTTEPLLIEKAAPASGVETATEAAPASDLTGAGRPAANQPPEQEPGTSANVSFLNYLVLTVEISLAFIAVLAGIIAIILRIRSR